VSIGVTSYWPKSGHSAGQLIEAADKALLRSEKKREKTEWSRRSEISIGPAAACAEERRRPGLGTESPPALRRGIPARFAARPTVQGA